jgi:hypothetical protein
MDNTSPFREDFGPQNILLNEVRNFPLYLLLGLPFFLA